MATPASLSAAGAGPRRCCRCLKTWTPWSSTEEIPMVMRFDRVAFKATRTDEGYIKDTPVLTRTGVFVYLDGQGRERREYRPPDEVFNADSLASLKGVPVTDTHPGKVSAR